VRKNYQNREIDTNQPAVSETVSVALDALAADMREGLRALAVGGGPSPSLPPERAGRAELSSARPDHLAGVAPDHLAGVARGACEPGLLSASRRGGRGHCS